MGTLNKTAVTFFDKFKNGGVASPTPSPTPVQEPVQTQSAWYNILKYLNPDPSAQAVNTKKHVTKPEPTPVDPYANFANKATGLPYK